MTQPDSSAATRLDTEAKDRVRRLRGLQRDYEGTDDWLGGVLGADAHLIEHLRFALEQAQKAGPMPSSSAAIVLERVRDRARNLSAVFPYQRRGEVLYLDPEDWKVLADELERLLRAET